MLNAFVIVASLAIVIQAGILLALFLTVKKTGERVESVAKQIEGRALPLIDSAQTILNDSGPRLKEITQNLSEVTGAMKGQVARMDATLTDLVDRSRLQIIRVDELVSRTIDKVEETTEIVQSTVITPVKQISGIMQGLTVGIGAFLQRRRKAAADAAGAVEDEEMFI